jgi:hypothetical protein
MALGAAVIPSAHVAALLWVLIRRRGMRPILVVNVLFGLAVLAFVWPYLPDELVDIRAGDAVELFDYKNTILTALELATLAASVTAWRGWLPGRVAAWVCFGGNLLLSIAAALFFMTFEFKCCGYL